MTEIPDNVRPGDRPATTRELWSVFRVVKDAIRKRPTITLLDTAAELPEHAAPDQLFRVATPAGERANLYMGTGPTGPLVKITGVPLGG